MIRQEAYQRSWTDIEQFAIDDPGSVVKFSDKLQHQQGWTTEFTARVITEYRKFLFLCMVAPEGASPSPIVDEAWHLHLTYTVNYWDGLCKKVLERPLHHHPSRGGPQEKERHVNWYRDTLVHYRHYFGEDPPRDIWPPPPEPASQSDPPPEFSSQYYLFLLLPFLVPFLFNKATPFDLTGPQFLLFFGIFTLTVIFLLTYQGINHIRQLRYRFEAIDTSGLNIFQFTRSVFGKHRMVQAAVVDLVERGCLKPVEKNRLQVTEKPDAFSKDYNPLLLNLYWFYQPGDNINMTSLERICNEEQSGDYLFDSEISNLPRHNWAAMTVIGGLLLTGVIRLLQGLENERPVGYLFLLLLVLLIAGAMFLQSQSARRLIRNLAVEKYNREGVQLKEMIPSPLTGRFIFDGMIALAALEGSDILSAAFQRQVQVSGYHHNVSSGCGGSGCSGGGDGGGCGGGGCGGCGGCGG